MFTHRSRSFVGMLAGAALGMLAASAVTIGVADNLYAAFTITMAASAALFVWAAAVPVYRVFRAVVASFARTFRAGLARFGAYVKVLLMRQRASDGSTLHYKAPGNFRLCGST